MKRATDAGFERASYTYAMTRKLWEDDGDHFSGFSRDNVAKIGLLVRSSAGLWNSDHNDYFHIRRHVFISTVEPLFLSCPCSPLWTHFGYHGTLNIGRLEICATGASGWRRLVFLYATSRHPPAIQTLKLGGKALWMVVIFVHTSFRHSVHRLKFYRTSNVWYYNIKWKVLVGFLTRTPFLSVAHQVYF